jgi:dTDP-4-amino-4,6-dideoxygalactose transaminase
MINLFKFYNPPNSLGEDLEKILLSGNLTSGTQVRIFEQQLREYIGNPLLLVTSNNTYASLIALVLCNLKNNDEVIASPMSCLASNQPVLNFGAKIIWADIDPLTGSLCPDDVLKKITSKTKAIIHYHWGGYPGHIDEINQIGRLHGIPVIDDAIESFGSVYKGKTMGNHGTTMTTFSFQTVRLPNSIDGGAISFSDELLFKKALLIRDFGINRSSFRDNLGEISAASNIESIGYNAVMNEISGYIGVKVLEQTAELIQKQRINASQWDNNFISQSGVQLLKRQDILPNYWIYSFLTNNRDSVLEKFRSKGFYASKVHIRNDHYSCFGKFDSTLIGTDEFSKKELCIPSGWWVNPEEILHGAV